MSKDNLGNCGCGCQKCGSKTATRSTQSKTAQVLVPSEYDKKSNIMSTKSDSTYSKKRDLFTTSSAKTLPVVADEILEPKVEVLNPNQVNSGDNSGLIITAIGFGLMLFFAAFREKSEKSQ